MKVIAKRNNSELNRIEYHLIRIGTWDHFSDIMKFFEKKFQAEAHVKTDGIFTRKWQIRCKGEYFMFEHHDDIGNWFYSCKECGDSPLMHEIAHELERRLSQE